MQGSIPLDSFNKGCGRAFFGGEMKQEMTEKR